ncbi:MAG: isocitrate/isopropylmalate family dehydrogenase [Bacteroidota bacterium]
MHLKIAILNEKGSSPLLNHQMMKAIQAVEEIFDHNFTYREIEIPQTGLPQAVTDLCKEADVVLHSANRVMAEMLQQQLKLHSSTHAFLGKFTNFFKRSANQSFTAIDFLLFQELEGGIPKIDEPWESGNTRATDFYEYTEAQITRIAHSAFKASKKRNKRLTMVHHDNHMLSTKLWCEVVGRVGESYPEVELNLEHVHVTTKNLLQHWYTYDVVLCDSLFGGVLANQSAGLAGFAPNILFGEDTILVNASPSENTPGVENPIGAVLSVALMFQKAGLQEEADIVFDAVEKSLQEGIVTPDLKATSPFGTEEVGDCIAEHILDWEERFIPNDENIDLGQSTII